MMFSGVSTCYTFGVSVPAWPWGRRPARLSHMWIGDEEVRVDEVERRISSPSRAGRRDARVIYLTRPRWHTAGERGALSDPGGREPIYPRRCADDGAGVQHWHRD